MSIFRIHSDGNKKA
ncbi:TPA: hypothetical protein ACJHC1_000780 [Escherichia coli]|nr:hypothetical protein [Escherichia coli]MDT1320359.1 hypothetical protein [Escherichia coli]